MPSADGRSISRRPSPLAQDKEVLYTIAKHYLFTRLLGESFSANHSVLTSVSISVLTPSIQHNTIKDYFGSRKFKAKLSAKSDLLFIFSQPHYFWYFLFLYFKHKGVHCYKRRKNKPVKSFFSIEYSEIRRLPYPTLAQQGCRELSMQEVFLAPHVAFQPIQISAINSLI